MGDGYEGSLKNNYLYQGAYSELDDDIGWNDFAMRNYDPQIGRWVQQDPYQQFASPYLDMADDPVNNTDPSGGIVLPYLKVIIPVANSSTKVLEVSGQVVNTLSLVCRANLIVHLVDLAVKAINISVNTRQVGDRLKIYMRGLSDAWWNAVSVGTKDAFFGGNHLSDYDDIYDQKTYLEGRQGGDAAAMAVGMAAAEGGAAAARTELASGGTATFLAGAYAAGAAFSGTVAGVAAADLVWATSKLLAIEGSSDYSAADDPDPALQNSKNETNWLKRKKAKEKADTELPVLDRSGKVHGKLPNPNDFGKYSKDGLRKLLEDLKKSVKTRIDMNILHGSDAAHGERQAAEQALIKSLEKYLGK